jgi:hypothetical protein
MFRRFLAILVPAVLMLCVATASASAATRFVATTGSDEAGNTCLVSVDPCQTVQWAITEAQAGDTLSLAEGTYVGEFRLNKELTVVGQGPSTLLEGEPTVQRPVYIQSNVALENLRIRGGLSAGSEAKDAIFIGGTGTQVSLNNVVAEQDPTAIEGRNAVYVSAGDSLTMNDSTITGVGTTCLWVSGSATVTGSSIAMTPGLRGGAALHVVEGGTADLMATSVTDSGEKIAEQGERGDALTIEGGSVTAVGSTFYGLRSIVASTSTLSMARDKIMGHEAGLVLHGGVDAELRDLVIAPSFGGQIGADVLTETENLAVTPKLTIVGSTLYANGPSRYRAARAILGDSPIEAWIADTILRAEGPNAADVETEGGSWSVTHSVFSTVYGSGFPAPGSGTNLAVIPSFAGNYQLTTADSALLDAGDPAEVNVGETDLAGQPRVLAADCDGAPDIGAFELVRADSCPVQSPGGATSQPQPQSQPPTTPAAPSGQTPVRPAVSGVRVNKLRKGPVLEFSLSEPASIAVTIFKATKHGAGKTKRTSYRSIAKFSEDAGAGRSVISLVSRIGSAKLISGDYRVTVIASANGMSSAKRTVSARFEDPSSARVPN